VTASAISPARRTATVATARRRHPSGKKLAPYLFIAPNLALFTLFVFVPLLFAIYVSFHEWTLIGKPAFNGLKNYQRLIHDREFWGALYNTALFTIATVPLSIGIGLALAIGLNRDLWARGLLRSAYFLPVIVSNVVTAIMAAWMFNDNYGVFNAAIKALGFAPVPWLSSTFWAPISLIITTVWTRLGFCMIVYLAALQTIPANLYEASQIDGATALQQFRYVTWPLLRPTTFLLLIINVIFSFQVFDLIYVMTHGGPGFSTTLMVQYIYQKAFIDSEMGYASALGLVLFVLISAFTVVQWRLNRRFENHT